MKTMTFFYETASFNNNGTVKAFSDCLTEEHEIKSYDKDCVLRYSSNGAVSPVKIIVPDTIPSDAVPEFIRTFKSAVYTADFHATQKALQTERTNCEVYRNTWEKSRKEFDETHNDSVKLRMQSNWTAYVNKLTQSQKVRHSIAVWRATVKMNSRANSDDTKMLGTTALLSDKNRPAIMLAVNEIGSVIFGSAKDNYNLGKKSSVFSPSGKVDDAHELFKAVGKPIGSANKDGKEYTAEHYTVRFNKEDFAMFRAFRAYLQDCCTQWFMDDKASVSKDIVMTVCALSYSSKKKAKHSTACLESDGKVKGPTFLINTYRILYSTMYGGEVSPKEDK